MKNINEMNAREAVSKFVDHINSLPALEASEQLKNGQGLFHFMKWIESEEKELADSTKG